MSKLHIISIPIKNVYQIFTSSTEHARGFNNLVRVLKHKNLTVQIMLNLQILLAVTYKVFK